MPVEAFLKVINRLPEPLLLVSGEGLVLGANRRLSRLGIDPRALVSRPLFELVDEPREAVAEYLGRCARTSEPLPGSLRFARAGGGHVGCHVDGSVLAPACDGSPAVVLLRLESREESVSKFLELNRRIEELGRQIVRRQQAEEELRAQKEWLAVTLSSIGDAVIATDTEGRVIFENPVAEALTGWDQTAASGRLLPEVFRIINEESRQVVESPVSKCLREGVVVGLANHTVLLGRDGAEIPIEDSAAPIRGADGRAQGVVLVFRDNRQRRRAEIRHRLLVEASRILGSSLDIETVLASICRLAVPVLADWCTLDLIGGDGTPQRHEVTHRDPEKVRLAHELRRRYPPRPDDDRGVVQVLRTGRPEHYPEITDEMLVRGARDPEHLDVLRQLGLTSALIVPLNARGHTLGALSLVSAESGYRYDEEDLQLALELASRAAMAVDNARLFSEATEAGRAKEQALELHQSMERQLSLLVEASGSLSASLESSAVLDAILTLSRRLIAADAYAIWRFHPATGRWGIGHSSGLSEEYRQSTIEILSTTPPLPESPVIAEDVLQQDLDLLDDRREAYRREGVRSLMVVPLRVRGELNGTIAFYYRDPHRFSPIEVGAATALANLAGSAIGTSELYEELKTRDLRKDEFLAMLAHELRNPLAAIANGSLLLASPATGPEDQAWAKQVIDRQVKHLCRLMDDLLEVSRVSRGQISLRTQPIDAHAVIRHAIDTVQPLLAERRHRLDVSYHPGPLGLDADAARLEQVLVNLLTNAAKYTDPGGQIALVTSREGDQAVITIRDSGVGMVPEQIPQMFELFVQGDRTLARSDGGLGIGLTLVKVLTEMHGGTVAARSEGIGRGSEFTIRLPARPSPPRPASAPGPGSPGSSPAAPGRKVLVVDDNLDAARGLARLLALHGHQVEAAHTGPDCLEAARRHCPEFVLLDIGLPGMDGYEVARRLRRDDRLKQVVLIAITGYGQDEDRHRALEAGFDHHLVKPIDHAALVALLQPCA